MLPDDKDALKVWLVKTLNPICDADPDTLANYVLALIKKDKSESDLIDVCNRDLKVFLQDRTESFVNLLFDALRRKAYKADADKASDKQLISTGNDHAQSVHLTSYKSLPKKDQEQIRPREFNQGSGRSRRSEKHVEGAERSVHRRSSKSPGSRTRRELSREKRKKIHYPERMRNKPDENSRSHSRDVFSPPLRLGKRSYTRSPSKSVDPSDRKSIERGSNHSSGGSSRSQSPEGPVKVAKKKRSPCTTRKDGERRQKCRKYYEQGFCELGENCAFDHGENPVPISNRDFVLQNTPTSLEYTHGVPSPAYMSQQGPPVSHLLNHPSRVIPNMSLPPPSLPYPPPHRLPPHFLQQPGNPMMLPQGPMRPMVPYPLSHPHRPPPPIYQYMTVSPGDLQQQQDVYRSGTRPPPVEPYMPESYSSKPSRFSVPPPPLQGQSANTKGVWKEGEGELEGAVPSVRQVSNLVHVSIEEGQQKGDGLTSNRVEEPESGNGENYEVDDASGKVPPYTPTPSSVLMARKRSAHVAGLEQQMMTGPLCVPVSVVSTSDDAKLMPPPSTYVKKTALEHPGISNRSQQATNTTLELRKIPREDNTIANINDHFSKYGIIINLQVNWDNDPCAALVSYASAAQALAAYRSKEPFLNNRFIKIFWHNPDKTAQLQQQAANSSGQNNTDTKPQERETRQKHKPIVFPQRHQLQLNNKLKRIQEAKKLEAEKPSSAGTTTPSTTISTTSSESAASPSTSQTSVSKTTAVPQEHQSQSTGERAAVPSAVHGGEVAEKPVLPPRSALRLQRKPSRESLKNTEMLKKSQELMQMKKNLLDKLVEAQKKLLDLMEKAKTSDEKVKISEEIKKNAAKIQQLHEETKKLFTTATPVSPPAAAPVDASRKLTFNPKNRFSRSFKYVRTNSSSVATSTTTSVTTQCSAMPTPTSTSPSSNKTAVQKEILDKELDLMNNSSQDAIEANVLKKKIFDLKKELNTMDKQGESYSSTQQGAPSASSAYSSYQSFNQSGRGGRVYAKVVRSVDRRPRQILVTGFPSNEDKGMILNHMKNFGQIEKSMFDEKSPFYLVTYKYRSDAEKAMREGIRYKDMKLKLTWHKSEIQQNQTQKSDVQAALVPAPPSLEKLQSTPSSSSSFLSSASSTHVEVQAVSSSVDLKAKYSVEASADDEGTSVEAGEYGKLVDDSLMEAKDDNDDDEDGDDDDYEEEEEDNGAAAGGENSYNEDELNEYRRWGLVGEEVDEDVLLGFEEEDEEDDDEGVRPWRR